MDLYPSSEDYSDTETNWSTKKRSCYISESVPVIHRYVNLVILMRDNISVWIGEKTDIADERACNVSPPSGV